MLDGLDHVDWDVWGTSQIRHWLEVAASADSPEARLTAISALEAYLVPWPLMTGYACEKDWDHLRELMNNNVPSAVVPFLIQLLKISNSPQDKAHLLGILIDLCRYLSIPETYHWPLTLELGNTLRAWATHLRGIVRTGVEVYRALHLDENPDVQTTADELLGVLQDL